MATLARSLLRPESRAIRDDALWGAWAAGDDVVANSAAGVRVSRNTALGLSAVWACVRIIADTIATLPVDTYTIDAQGVKSAHRPRPVWMDPDNFNAPNPEQTAADFWFGVVASLLLDGNAFIYTVRNAMQEVVEVWAIDPQWVLVRREPMPDGSLALVYYIQVARGQQSPVGPERTWAGPFSAPDMFHLTAFNPNSNWPRGLSPLEMARQMFGSGIANQQMAAEFYGHGMNAHGVIELPGDMTIDQARELKEDLKRGNGGFRKFFQPPVLTGGASWKQISINPEQAQFLESRQAIVQDVARWFGVPLWMIQSVEKTTSWGTGVEQQGLAFATYTIGTWTTKIELGFQKHTLLPFHPGVVFGWDLKKLMRGDHATRAAFSASGRQWGWLSANDVRISEGMDGIGPEGDVYLVPVNMTDPGVSDPASVPMNPLGSTTAPAQAPAEEEDEE